MRHTSPLRVSRRPDLSQVLEGQSRICCFRRPPHCLWLPVLLHLLCIVVVQSSLLGRRQCCPAVCNRLRQSRHYDAVRPQRHLGACSQALMTGPMTAATPTKAASRLRDRLGIPRLPRIILLGEVGEVKEGWSSNQPQLRFSCQSRVLPDLGGEELEILLFL
jgi:hypothetical protein